MKLATYKDGSRDGQLVVVSRNLTLAHYATGVASKLQQVLDDWNFMSPQLQDISDALNQPGQARARHAFPFDPARCMAPLPRAYRWVAGSAFTQHAALLHPQRGADLHMDPGASDDLAGPHDAIVVPSAEVADAWGVDFDAGLAVITGDVPRWATPAQALSGVRLVMLANDVSLRHLMADALARGAGCAQGKPGTAFSPVAVTPDELVLGGESSWRQGRLHLSVQSTWNGRKVGMVEAGPEMTFGFGELIAHLCQTRPVRAGSVIGSGPVTNVDRSRGYSCIAQKRALETTDHGQPKTPYMALGDTVRIEVKGKDGLSVFGAINQTVALTSLSALPE
jgi:fumarylacetoacetate (FAA) hydrolase